MRARETRKVYPVVTADGSISNVGFLEHENGTTIREIPADSVADDTWPSRVSGLDRGSPGAASSNFIENIDDPDIEYLFLTVYDKFHALIRDMKNAINKSLLGEFNEIMCQSSYLWGLNYKPFGSGEWRNVKMEILDSCLASHDCSSPIFLKYVGLIADGFGVTTYDGGEEYRNRIFAKLSEMKSFIRKGTTILNLDA